MLNLPARGDMQAAREFQEHLRQGTLRSAQERRRNRGGRGGHSGRGGYSGHGGHDGHSSRGGRAADNHRQIPISTIAAAPVPRPAQHGNSLYPSVNASSTAASADGEPMDIDPEPPSPKRTLLNSPWAGTSTSHVSAPRPAIKLGSPAVQTKRAPSPNRGLANSPWAASSGGQERSVVQEPEEEASSTDASGVYHDNDWQYTYSLEDRARSYSQAADNARAAGDLDAEAKLHQVANLCSQVIHARLKLRDQKAEREASVAANQAIQLAQFLHGKYSGKTTKVTSSQGQGQKLSVSSSVDVAAHRSDTKENEPLQASHSTTHGPVGAGPPQAQPALARRDNARKLFLEHWRLNCAM